MAAKRDESKTKKKCRPPNWFFHFQSLFGVCDRFWQVQIASISSSKSAQKRLLAVCLQLLKGAGYIFP